MPPLMLTSDEIEAAILGAQWVRSRGEPELALALALAAERNRYRLQVHCDTHRSGPN